MKTPASTDTPLERLVGRGEAAVGLLRRYFAGYFWLILKNVIGWLLILLSVPAGLALPGPGGLPMFFIGFALVTFPGKRRLTSRFMRGRPLRLEAGIFTFITTLASLGVVAALIWLVGDRWEAIVKHLQLEPRQTPGLIAAVAGACVVAAGVTWGMTQLGLRFLNVLFRFIPRMRRLMRRLLRKWGIVLLPPPRRPVRPSAAIGRDPAEAAAADIAALPAVLREQTEILEFSDASRVRLARLWAVGRPWLMRMLTLGLTVAIFYFIVKPVYQNWPSVEANLNQIPPARFVTAVLLFAAFLIVFRLPTWRRILAATDRALPSAAALRVWVTSELARYLPGVVWQVSARAWLVKPYGVGPASAARSQLLELILFVGANLVVALGCLLWYGYRDWAGQVRWWVPILMAIAPAVLIGLHPRVFYPVLDRVLGWFARPPMVPRLGGGTLFGLFAWNVTGLIVQGLAIYLIVAVPLQLPISKWWLVTGAYCLSWCAGFLAFWAPGGLGVREFVFMAAVVVALPASMRQAYNTENLHAFAAFLAILLRAWSTAGELIVAWLAYVLDLSGAANSVRGNRPLTPGYDARRAS